ncbi:MAG: hypothetical protein H7227_06335 [Actinobacteria bacterium]|nr:hypothetical protein [Actinomycetota bacterium]
MPFAKSKMRGEDGVFESTLVMIPLLALFLLTLEIVIAVNFRNVDLTLTQSDASTRAISSVVTGDDEVLKFKSRQSLESIRVLITHRQRTLPRLVPKFLLPGQEGDHSVDVSGIAVIEENQ